MAVFRLRIWLSFSYHLTFFKANTDIALQLTTLVHRPYLHPQTRIHNSFTFLAHLSMKCSRRVIVIAFYPASVNIFSSVTSASIEMKLHRKHSLNVLTRILFLPDWLADFFNNFVEMFHLSDSYKLCWLVKKHGEIVRRVCLNFFLGTTPSVTTWPIGMNLNVIS